MSESLPLAEQPVCRLLNFTCVLLCMYVVMVCDHTQCQLIASPKPCSFFARVCPESWRCVTRPTQRKLTGATNAQVALYNNNTKYKRVTRRRAKSTIATESRTTLRVLQLSAAGQTHILLHFDIFLTHVIMQSVVLCYDNVPRVPTRCCIALGRRCVCIHHVATLFRA